MGRRTIAPGIYADAYGYEIRVKRGGKAHSVRAPKTATPRDLEFRRAELLVHVLATDLDAAPKGTLTRSIGQYIRLAKHLAGWRKQRSHLRAFVPALGRKDRSLITRQDILALRSQWAEAGVAPNTINNRLSALRQLYLTLDGPDSITPVDRIPPLRSHPTPPQRIPAELIRTVDRHLQANEQRGYLHDAKTRARFRVLATTGVRPSELMRAKPSDVDLEERVWHVRDGKGGFRPGGLPLTDEAVAAFALFAESRAWGVFNTNSFARVLRSNGWPAGVRPYQLRHTLGLSLSAQDIDLADIGLVLGHKSPKTTRRHYIGPEFRRMQHAMGTLESRLQWEALPPGSTTRSARTETKHDEKVPTSTNRRRRRTEAKPPQLLEE